MRNFCRTSHSAIFKRILASLLIFLMMAEPALAVTLDCSAAISKTNNMGNTGGITIINTAMGTMDTSCNATGSNTIGIFSRITCIFKTQVGLVMSQTYCNFQTLMKGPISDALIVCFAVYGIMMITGMVNNPTRDSAALMFKIALIWAFATSSQFGIGYAYTFFMEGAEFGANLAIKALGGTTALSAPDQTLANSMSGMMGGTITGTSPFPASLSPYCKNMIIVALTTTAVLLPVVPVTIIGLAMQYLQLFARALLGYFVAFTLICFLFVFSPIFLGFGLFKATYQLFEAWLKYLTVLALQVILTFAFFSVITSIIKPMAAFAPEMLGLIREYNDTWQKNSFTLPMHPCSFCKYTITCPSGQSGTWPKCSGTAQTTSLTRATIACDTSQYSKSAGTPYLPSVATDGNNNPVSGYPNLNQNVIPLWTLLADTGNSGGAGGQELLMFLMENFFALWLIVGVMMELFKRVEELAKNIGGLPFAVGIIGDGLPGATGGDVSIHYKGMDTVQSATKSMQNLLSIRPWNPKP